MAGTPIGGWEGRVQIGTLFINLEEWEVTPAADPIETQNYESLGSDGLPYKEGIFGFIGAKVRFKGFWDAALNPHVTTGPNLRAGVIIATPVLLYVRKTGVRCFTFPQFRCTSTPVVSQAKTRVDISVEGENQGQFTYPN